MADPAEKRRNEALEVLRLLGMPGAQQNDRSAHTFLALLDLTPEKRWSEARARPIGIHEIMGWLAECYNVRYAENTRETIRRQTIHQFEQAALVVRNPDDPNRPVNSPKTVYQIDTSILDLVREYGTRRWRSRLEAYLAEVETLKRRYQQVREASGIPVEIAPGVAIKLSAGGQNPLIKRIVEDFIPKFVEKPKVLYLGDARAKQGYFDEDGLRRLGLEFNLHGQMPDVITYDQERNWLLLIEAVTSHGPVSPKRLVELKGIFAKSKVGLVFVTAFPDRRTFSRYIAEIAWETEVWIAEDPTHMIHWNGERFLGPYL